MTDNLERAGEILAARGHRFTVSLRAPAIRDYVEEDRRFGPDGGYQLFRPGPTHCTVTVHRGVADIETRVDAALAEMEPEALADYLSNPNSASDERKIVHVRGGVRWVQE